MIQKYVDLSYYVGSYSRDRYPEYKAKIFLLAWCKSGRKFLNLTFLRGKRDELVGKSASEV